MSACNCHSIVCVPQTGQPAANTCDTIAQEDVLGTFSLKMMMMIINLCLFVLIERFRVMFIANGKRQNSKLADKNSPKPLL